METAVVADAESDAPQESSTTAELVDPRLIAAVVAIAYVVLAVVHLDRPFWVDELSTVWMVDRGWSSLWGLLEEFVANGRLYPVAMWVWSTIVGTSPFALRLPSLLAVAGAAVVVHRTAAALDRPAAGWTSATVFLLTTQTFVSAGNARSYGIALLFMALTNMYAVRWMRTGSTRTALAATIFACLGLHTHLLMGFGVVPLAAALWVRRRRSPEDWWHGLHWPAAAAAILLVPLAIMARSAANTGAFDPDFAPTLSMALKVLAPTTAIIVVAAAVVIGRGLRPSRVIPSDEFSYLVVAAIVPLALSWTLARGLGLGVFLSRYLVSIIPPTAIVIGLLIAHIRMPAGRLFALAGLAVLGLSTLASGAGESDSWEQAVDWANGVSAGRDAVVIVEPLHIMGRNEENFTDEAGNWIFEDADSLGWVNPIEPAHPVDAPFYGLPFAADDWGPDYLDALLPARVLEHELVVLIGYDFSEETDYSELVRDRLGTAGYVEVPPPSLDREVLVFVRS